MDNKEKNLTMAMEVSYMGKEFKIKSELIVDDVTSYNIRQLGIYLATSCRIGLQNEGLIEPPYQDQDNG